MYKQPLFVIITSLLVGQSTLNAMDHKPVATPPAQGTPATQLQKPTGVPECKSPPAFLAHLAALQRNKQD